MATHDYVISNGTGSAVRSDINGALAAIVSQNSNASEPSPTYAYMRWADTTAGVMKMRNGANSAWISLYELDGTFLASDISLAAGSAAAPSLFFTGDTNTGIYSPGADQVGIATGGTSRIVVDASGNVNIDSGTLYVDNTNNRVGIGGITSPLFPVDVNGTIYTRGRGSTFGVLFDDWRIYNSTSPGALVFNNGSDRATLDSSGRFLVGVSANANGGILQLSSGITFPATQVASADPNTLDDYEEGTWTPTIIGTTTAGTATYSAQVARYTKIGRVVQIEVRVSWSSGNGTGNLRIAGLPFTSVGNTSAGLAVGQCSGIALTASHVLMAQVADGSTQIRFTSYPAGGGANVEVAYDADGPGIVVGGTYSV